MKRHRSGSLLSGGDLSPFAPPPPKTSRVVAGSGAGIHSRRLEPGASIVYSMINDVYFSASLLSLEGSSVSETEAQLKKLMSLFPLAVFEGQLPPILLRHQVYSVLQDRTLVDRELVRHTKHSPSSFESRSSFPSLPSPLAPLLSLHPPPPHLYTHTHTDPSLS